MKKCILILTHKEIDHIYMLASQMPEINFYIHLDKKIDINTIRKNIKNNLHFVDDREDVSWAGFSMIKATINLILYALKHDDKNEYFHLVSGDDVFLDGKLSWESTDIFMECKESKEHQYRMRFDTPHADTKYQRSILGKVLTQLYKKIDKLLRTNEHFYFGSQWFSIRRNELEILMNSITETDLNFFRRKLCPDEHFFQYLVVKTGLLANISKNGNKRFIEFDPSFQRGSSPVFLKYEQLKIAKDHKFWFARKVEPKVMQKFYLIGKEE